MKRFRLLLLLMGFLFTRSVMSQISYGGVPHFPATSTLRSSTQPEYIRMPSFDTDSLLREDQINERNMRGSYRFAHKFHTEIEKRSDGRLTLLPDGTRVWTIGIASEGAYSINLLLKDVSIPEGGELFVYNEDHTHVIGRFDSRNISASGLLPLRPVAGDKIIIEYSEPPTAPFEGNFVVAEVNHDYRDFLRRSPDTDKSSYSCMQDALCSDIDRNLIRATVLLMINGTQSCTGTLINNSENDGTPYLLTAVHCLNSSASFPKTMDYYIDVAGTIITFFNYDRYICGSDMKGVEEMSIASTYPRAVVEKKDLALLELPEAPPVHYNVYYAGWSLDQTGAAYPYRNLHHPSAAVKKYGLFNGQLQVSNYAPSPSYFDRNSHWQVGGWTAGSTYSGSSGSPLFDRDGLIVGGLTGGNSACKDTGPNGYSDYFFNLFKGWEGASLGAPKSFLDRSQEGLLRLEGFDPHAKRPLARLGNIDFSSNANLETSTFTGQESGFVFGNSSRKTFEFAEQFYAEEKSLLHGAYLIVPTMFHGNAKGINVSVYSGQSKPETLLTSKIMNPQYLNNSSSTEAFLSNKEMHRVPTENFIVFDQPVDVKGNFFISYRVVESDSYSFCVYNTVNTGNYNTAWVLDNDEEWVTATNYPSFGKPASLTIQALLQPSDTSGIVLPESKHGIADLRYDPASGTLYFLSDITVPGILMIYAVTGQLIEQIPLVSGRLIYPVKKMATGSMAIVKIQSEGESFSTKIIF